MGIFVISYAAAIVLVSLSFWSCHSARTSSRTNAETVDTRSAANALAFCTVVVSNVIVTLIKTGFFIAEFFSLLDAHFVFI
jgi:hypothetical protein